jgi:ribose 5-phosphate isomerase RpiB
LGLVVAAPSDKVENLLAAMRIDGLSVQSFNQTDCWMRNLESLCDAIAGGSVKAAVLLAPYAADAMVLAGKCKGVLAVQGTRADSVAAAVRHYGANLLVLEYAVSTYHEMRQMVRVFAAPRPAPNAGRLLEKVAALEART